MVVGSYPMLLNPIEYKNQKKLFKFASTFGSKYLENASVIPVTSWSLAVISCSS